MSVECRRTLGGIECSDASARASADVNETAASLQSRCDDVDGTCDLWQDTLYRGSDSGIFGIHDARQLQRWFQIQVRRSRIRFFSDETD